MEPPPLATPGLLNRKHNYPLLFATRSAVAAVALLPLSLIPFLGLALSGLGLGLIGAVAVWTRRKRAYVATATAVLAGGLAMISALITVESMVASRNAATTRLAQIQAELQTAKNQTVDASGKSALGSVIQMFDKDHELTKEQANGLGAIAEWALKEFASENNPK